MVHPIFIIGVAGSSGSGKTSFCKELVNIIKEKFGEDIINEIDLDGFYKDIPPSVNGNDYNWDSPNAFDINKILETLRRLKNGESVWIPKHDYKNYKMIPNAILVNPTKFIIIENLFTLYWEKILPFLDLKIFIECHQDLALARRIIRDTNERHYDDETILRRYFTFVKPSFRKYIKKSKNNATIIIQNNNGFSNGKIECEKLNIVISYIENKIKI